MTRPMCPTCGGLLEDAVDETSPCMNVTCLNSARAREVKPAPRSHDQGAIVVPGGKVTRQQRRANERAAAKAARRR